MVKILVQKCNRLRISSRIVFPVHPLQGGVAPGLHGQVELRAEIGQGGCPAAEVLCDGPGLQAPQPDADGRCGGADSLQQVDQGLPVFQVLAPGGDLDARHHDLPVALRCQRPGLLHGSGDGQGPHPSPGVGDDAVGAEVDAPVLHLQHGPGAALQAAGGQDLEHPPLKGLVDGLDLPLLRRGLLQKADEARPVAGAGDQVHPQLPHVVHMGLGIAAAHRHHCARVLPLDAVDHLPGLLVADRRDGAGVHDVCVRLLRKLRERVPPGQQLLLHGLGLILVHLAAQGIDGNFHGISLHFPQNLYIITWCVSIIL